MYIYVSNNRDTNLYINLYTKITCDNTPGMLYQLKLNDMNYFVIYHVGFVAQISRHVHR